MTDLERRAFYMTPNDGVVQPIEKTDRVLVVENPETGGRWTINREPFEQRVATGHIQRVEPNWEPVGDRRVPA